MADLLAIDDARWQAGPTYEISWVSFRLTVTAEGQEEQPALAPID
jgi:hypothetical protein